MSSHSQTSFRRIVYAVPKLTANRKLKLRPGSYIARQVDYSTAEMFEFAFNTVLLENIQ